MLAGITALVVPAVLCAQAAPARVTFEVYAPSLPDTASVYIAGSAPALGHWNPAAVRLVAQGNHRWRLVVPLIRSPGVEYKFTLGAWEREAADASGAPQRNRVADIRGDTTLTATIDRWTTGNRPRALTGGVTGTLRYHRGIGGEGLAARDIVVWLPPSYDTDRSARYPVLYLLDGQNVFDPATSSYGTDWAADEAADSLIRAHAIPPLIIVAVNNTPSRNAEYLPGDSAVRHMNFMRRVVKPLIDSMYRTQRDARSTMVGGSSAGGIAAFMMAWEHPEAFSKALAFSPAFQAPAGSDLHFDYVQEVRLTARFPKPVRFYIDIGGVGLEARLRPGVDAMVQALERRGYRAGSDFLFVADSAAEHNEAAWRRRLPAALVWVMRP